MLVRHVLLVVFFRQFLARLKQPIMLAWCLFFPVKSSIHIIRKCLCIFLFFLFFLSSVPCAFESANHVSLVLVLSCRILHTHHTQMPMYLFYSSSFCLSSVPCAFEAATEVSLVFVPSSGILHAHHTQMPMVGFFLSSVPCAFEAAAEVSLASLPVAEASEGLCQQTCNQVIGCVATAPSGHATLPPFTHCLLVVMRDSTNPLWKHDCRFQCESRTRLRHRWRDLFVCFIA